MNGVKSDHILINGDRTPITTKYKFEIYTQKKIKVKKPILSTLDTILSVFLIGPCVVGFWRGTWQLLDLYGRFFPPWESFFFSVFIHVSFILLQDTFDGIFVRKTMSICRKIVHYTCMRIYTYFFAITCNLSWRAGWALFDHYLDVQFDHGTTLRRGSCKLAAVFFASFLIVLMLKSLINCIAPPFCICLDKPKQTFAIQTRFKAKILYIIIQLIGKTSAEVNRKTESERIVLNRLEKPPKPFANIYKGDHPVEFTPTTEKSTTLTYPQLTNYNKDYPKSIQDVIGYANANRFNRLTKIYPTYHKESTIDLHQKAVNFTSVANDPFYPYKPQDPGDINLLAMSSLRFAPPVWTNLKKKKVQQLQQDSERHEVTHNHRVKKPMSVTLNIYPDEKEDFTKAKLKSMIIRLNLFPDGIANGESKTKVIGRFSTIPPII